MNILSIVNLFSFGIAASNWFMEALIKMLLFFDGVAYTLVAYSFKLFQLMCTLNFNSLYSIVTPILSRIEALVMVFVVYKLGISLINFMLKPEDASKKGKEILINILITAVLLISYNTIFGIFNELSMLMIGVPENYSFTYLGQIADLTESKDSGLINRLVFGTDEQMTDVGEYIAFSMCSLFITNSNDPNDTTLLQNQIASDKNPGHADFNKLPNIASQVGKQFDYFTLVGFGVCIYMIYSFVKATIQVGVRAFKILILQILAPIAIITIIGEGVKGKTFKSFLNKYVAVYIELFIRMFSILLISTFVVKFIRNIGDFIANLNSEEWYTYALMIALIILAAFKFAGDIPKFIDEILSTHLSDNKGKGGFGHFAAGLLGAGVGLAAGLSTGTLAGTVSGLVGGASSGAKGKNVADFFKGQAQNGANARNVGANARMAGGTLAYAGSKVDGFFSGPQKRLEKGKLASERQTAMDNMVKSLEDNYDEQVNIGGQNIGLTRDIFKNYASGIEVDKSGAITKKDPYGYYDSLSADTQTAVYNTQKAYSDYKEAQGIYERMRTTGEDYDFNTKTWLGPGSKADETKIGEAWDAVEGTRTAYQSLKSSSDKKVDTDFNTRMLRNVTADSKTYVKEKGRQAVSRSIETYDNVADSRFTTERIVSGTPVTIKDGNGVSKDVTPTTKTASDLYTRTQDRTTHSRIATRYTNSQNRGGSGK